MTAIILTAALAYTISKFFLLIISIFLNNLYIIQGLSSNGLFKKWIKKKNTN